MKETILIIGCGEIGTALISGWLKKRKDFKKKISRIYILEKSIARKKYLKKKFKKEIFFIEKKTI